MGKHLIEHGFGCIWCGHSALAKTFPKDCAREPAYVTKLRDERDKLADQIQRIGNLLEEAQKLDYSASINNGVAAILNET